jgi:hypothetical protein
MPFNRADYFVGIPSAANPDCAPGTGTLYKKVINDTSPTPATEVPFLAYPLIQCVANMQVVFRLDTSLDGIPDQTVNDISGLDAYTTKTQIKEVHIYLLVHEGIKDTSFKSDLTSSSYVVGPSATLGGTVDLSALDTTSATAWKYYRWKTYKLVVKPKSFY